MDTKKLPTQYQEFIHLSRYARYNEELGRRETWSETVKRYCDFWKEKFPARYPYDDIYSSIVNLEVMPSMRALMSAGPALERDNVAGYNCSYLPIDHIRAFDEVLYILMCGCGVGFSVEEKYVKKLPEVPEELRHSSTIIIVEDSKIGWAVAFRQFIALLYSGQIAKWDVHKVRPNGARLKTFGGRASGPEPLASLFQVTAGIFERAKGRKLNTLETHDIICKVADCVVVGGVRRSALISLSDLNDPLMRHAKQGAFWETNPQRTLANNSVAYSECPDVGTFMDEWRALYGSRTGERGIFNREAAQNTANSNGRRVSDIEFGTNPCGEIILRPQGFCNLTEVVVRHSDTLSDLKRKVGIATIIGTFQSTLTNFRYLRKVWTTNAEEERLLGVSLTGIMDNDILSESKGIDSKLLELRDYAIETNKNVAKILGIPQSTAITTVKPSGTVSQLVDSASGIHPRHSPYYIRTVRADKKDPLALFMRTQGFPVESDISRPDSVDVFSFPIKSPNTSIFRDERTAIEQLDHYLLFAKWWCEHNPSITVYVKEHEWIEVEAWVYKHFNEIGGISFLPYDGGVYQQAPYQEITEKDYKEYVEKMPKNVHWEDLKEETDQTSGMQELACFAGVCEIN